MRASLKWHTGAAALVAVLAAVHGCGDGDGGGQATPTPPGVWAWGNNVSGRLGDGTTTFRTAAVQVLGPGGVDFLSDVLALVGGAHHTVAVRTDGTVWAWGANYCGQLGDGTLAERSLPIQVLGPGGTGFLTGARAVAGGNGYSVALGTDGTVWTWGDNTYGQLGDGTTAASNVPVQVVGPGGSGFLTDIQAVAAGCWHTAAVKTDGTVWTWGFNQYGELGDGTTSIRRTPVQVLGPGGVGFLADVQDVAAGDAFTAALKADGTVWAWGDNSYGILGNGTSSASWRPVQVVGLDGNGFLAGVKAIAAGDWHTVAINADNTLCAWGSNIAGKLGDGTTANSATPVQIVGPGGSGLLTDVGTIAAGCNHTVAVGTDGTVWTWGDNSDGQLGDGTTTGSRTPVQVLGPDGAGFLTGATAAAAGGYHSLALVPQQ